jgi:hypothetical protein
MRLRRGETVPALLSRTDSEFAVVRWAVIICAVLTVLSVFRPMLPLGNRPRRCGCADHHEGSPLIDATRAGHRLTTC